LGSSWLGGKEEAQASGGVFEVSNGSLPKVVGIALLTLRLIRRAIFQDLIENTSQLMGGRGEGVRRVFASPHTPLRTAQRRLGVPQRLRRQAQPLRRAAVAFAGFAAQPLAPRAVVRGSHSQPGGKVLLGGPFPHIGADFRQPALR